MKPGTCYTLYYVSQGLAREQNGNLVNLGPRLDVFTHCKKCVALASSARHVRELEGGGMLRQEKKALGPLEVLLMSIICLGDSGSRM